MVNLSEMIGCVKKRLKIIWQSIGVSLQYIYASHSYSCLISMQWLKLTLCVVVVFVIGTGGLRER